MATPIQSVLKTPANQPTTVKIDSAQHTSSTAALTASPATLSPVSQITAGPSQIVPAASRNTLVISNPVDGKLVYVGQDGTVNLNSGHALYPGNQLTITGYIGAIWVVSSNGPATIFTTVS